MVICLERDADLHIAQLMPLPLTVSCFSKIQIGFTLVPEKEPLNGCLCVTDQLDVPIVKLLVHFSVTSNL